MINKNLIEKYHIYSIEENKKLYAEKGRAEIIFYYDFLKATDYLAIKLAEGLITREDRKAEFDARDFARAEINRLEK